jgi:hypothetical protein
VTARDLHSPEVEAARKAWMDSWARYTVAPGENDDRILRLRLADALAAAEPIIRADELRRETGTWLATHRAAVAEEIAQALPPACWCGCADIAREHGGTP